jgi:hypothetical protein
MLLLFSCTKYGGGAKMESCSALKKLGYYPPYTEQERAEIKALNLEHCIE